MKNHSEQNIVNSPKAQETVPPSLITAIFIHIYIGWSFLFLTKFGAERLSNNAYLGLIPAVLFVLPSFWMAADLAGMYPRMTITTILTHVFGKLPGRIFGVAYLLSIVFACVIAMREAQLMIHSYFFLRTPFYLISTVFTFGTTYLGLKGIQPIGRLASFMMIPPLVIVLGLELLGLVNINGFNIQPVFSASPGKWLLTGLDMGFAFLPAPAILLYMVFFREPKNVAKAGLSAIGAIFPLFFLAVLGINGAFSPKIAQMLNWPVVEFFHLIDYPYLLLEQAGLFFLIAWYASFFVAFSQVFFILSYNFNRIFPKVKTNWSVIALNGLTLVLCNLPVNVMTARNALIPYQRIILIYTLVLTTLTWGIACLRCKNKKVAVS